MKPMLIAFTGPAGCGKDTAAEFLVDEYHYVQESFAKNMKIGLKVMLGLDDDQLFGRRKAEPIEGLNGVSPRDLLQSMGTDWGRNMIDPDIWLINTKKNWRDLVELCESPNIESHIIRGMVISDLRFENEAEWVRSQGGIVVHIKPAGGFEKIRQSGHASEEGVLVDLKRDALVNNDHRNGGLVAFKQTLEELMTAIHDHKDGVKSPQTVEGLQASISDWADTTFPDRTITNALCKLVMEEIPEYLTSQHDPMELADIAILVFDIASLAGIDLKKAVDKKMRINRERTWVIDEETGLMNHVK